MGPGNPGRFHLSFSADYYHGIAYDFLHSPSININSTAFPSPCKSYTNRTISNDSKTYFHHLLTPVNLHTAQDPTIFAYAPGNELSGLVRRCPTLRMKTSALLGPNNLRIDATYASHLHLPTVHIPCHPLLPAQPGSSLRRQRP